MRSPSPSIYQSARSTNTEEIDQELLSSAAEEEGEEETISSMSIDNEDLMRKVERFFRNNSEDQLEDHSMQIDSSLQSKINV